MSATINEDAAKSVANQPGEIGSHIQPTAPQTTSGHQPGQLVSPKDKAPESTAKVLPPGTAPPSKTFKPNNENEALAGDEALATAPSASDTLIGSTSADVHTGIGHPGSGQTSQELHDNTQHPGGLQGVGAHGAASHTQFASNKVDMSTSVQGATQKNTGEAVPADEDRDMQPRDS